MTFLLIHLQVRGRNFCPLPQYFSQVVPRVPSWCVTWEWYTLWSCHWFASCSSSLWSCHLGGSIPKQQLSGWCLFGIMMEELRTAPTNLCGPYSPWVSPPPGFYTWKRSWLSCWISSVCVCVCITCPLCCRMCPLFCWQYFFMEVEPTHNVVLVSGV